VLVLAREKDAVRILHSSASMLVHSQVPEGKGVSSSAAIEVATMAALVAAFAITCEPKELAILCQKVRWSVRSN
jgi:L-arabinokinase